MNNLSKIITAFSVSEFLNEVFLDNQNISKLNEFSEDCELLGGDTKLFLNLAVRELEACRLLEQEGGAAPAASTGPTNVTAGVAGLKPEDMGVPVEAQRRHTSKNSIFRRKKPNKYFTDKENSY